MNIIYKIDSDNRVIPCADDNGQEIVQGEYRGSIDGNAYEEHGIPLYKRYNGACVPRTSAEIQEDIEALPVPETTAMDILRADVDFLLMLMEE